MINDKTLLDLGRAGEDWIDKFFDKKVGTSSIWTKSVAAEFADICENNIEALLGVSGDKELDSYFLNAGKWLYPYYIDMIIDLWEERKKRNIEYIFLIGAFGVGKTAVNSVLAWLFWFDFTVKYKEDSIVACPQEYFGLRPTSKVAFLSLSKTLQKSKDITFNEMKSSFKTQFNNEYFPINERIQSRIDIPSNNTLIFPNTATEAANAGYNVYAACFTKGTIISTKYGDVSIDDIIKNNEAVNVVTASLQDDLGIEYSSPIIPIKTGNDVRVYELKLSNGMSIKATGDQKFLCKTDGYEYKQLIDLYYKDFVVVYRDGRFSLSAVDSVNYVGREDVYDFVDTGKNHNFIANGMVVHNCMDEINFLEVVDNSARALGAADTVYDQAESAFMSADGRRKSRFKRHGGGVMICFSSVNHSEDFLFRKAKDYYRGVNRDNTYIRFIQPWEARPDDFSSGKYFYINTENLQIIENEEHIDLLDDNYVEPDPFELRFGEHKDDPNVKMLLEHDLKNESQAGVLSS